MVNSYEDMMGTPMDVAQHPAYNVKPATDQYAGDVLPMPGERSMGAGPTSQAADYAVGKAKDPKIQSIGMSALKSWHDRNK